ncbi:MAG: ligase-associated DNA damage response endonuclease PdeM [Paracoccaceae bacterium]
MNNTDFTLNNTILSALPSGALWWAMEKILTVSDLHLGKSDRIVRRNGLMLPPYETRDTLARLQADISSTNPSTIICLGDSFDDLTAADTLSASDATCITKLQAGRRWIWIEGNHDPGPQHLTGTHLASFKCAPLTFRHIADPKETAEISGHYHPKATLHARHIHHPCLFSGG